MLEKRKRTNLLEIPQRRNDFFFFSRRIFLSIFFAIPLTRYVETCLPYENTRNTYTEAAKKLFDRDRSRLYWKSRLFLFLINNLQFLSPGLNQLNTNLRRLLENINSSKEIKRCLTATCILR